MTSTLMNLIIMKLTLILTNIKTKLQTSSIKGNCFWVITLFMFTPLFTYCQSYLNESLEKASQDSVLHWKKSSSAFTSDNCSTINTKHDEKSPCFYPNGLLFSSNKPHNLLTKRPGNYDFYWVRTDDNGSMGNSYSLSKKLNTKNDELGICHDSINKALIFGRKVEGDSIKLFRSLQNGNLWTTSEKFMMNNHSFSFSHPTISADGKIFIFASDLQNGFGGMDLYICFKTKNNLWTTPQNLGPKINTSGDETTPFLNKNGALYFASNGHPGYGGLDIFQTFFLDEWHTPINMKTPINSTEDDQGFVISHQLNRAFLSSNRIDGQGGMDIYRIRPLTSNSSSP